MLETVSHQLSSVEYQYTIKQTSNENKENNQLVAIILIYHKILLINIKENT